MKVNRYEKFRYRENTDGTFTRYQKMQRVKQGTVSQTWEHATWVVIGSVGADELDGMLMPNDVVERLESAHRGSQRVYSEIERTKIETLILWGVNDGSIAKLFNTTKVAVARKRVRFLQNLPE